MSQAVASYAHVESHTTQFDTFSGLNQWLLWLAVMVAGCLVLLTAYQIGSINYGMYLVITGLAVGLIIKGYLDARFLDRETKLADSQVKILEQVDDFESFLSIAPSSVFRNHIENLNTIAKSHSEINQGNLIEVIHARLTARNKVTELFASILITLGLIGTIVGLIVMMTELSVVMEQGIGDDFIARLANSSDGPLSGLGVAFVTTLLGAVFGGVILRVLTSVVDANIIRYTAHLAELSEVYVLPYMRQMALNARIAEHETDTISS